MYRDVIAVRSVKGARMHNSVGLIIAMSLNQTWPATHVFDSTTDWPGWHCSRQRVALSAYLWICYRSWSKHYWFNSNFCTWEKNRKISAMFRQESNPQPWKFTKWNSVVLCIAFLVKTLTRGCDIDWWMEHLPLLISLTGRAPAWLMRVPADKRDTHTP